MWGIMISNGLPIFGSLILLARICCAVYIPPGPRYNCPANNQLIHPCVCTGGTDDGLFIRCENTNLASLSVAMNNVAVLAMPVEELIFYKCRFTRLYGNIFYKTKARVLRIDQTPITHIDEHTFYGINRTLQELFLTNTVLEEFPKKAFMVLGNVTLLKIDQHRITKLDKDIFADSMLAGRLERFHLTNGNLSELPIESLQPLRKLKILDLHGNELDALQRNQFKNLRDVELLDLSFNRLKKLDSSHIADLTKMGWCNVSHNELGELTRGTFARNAVLKVLNMSFNKIKRLDSNSFRGMRFLRRLYLSDNLINDVGRGTFGSITRIGTIDLSRNDLDKIDFQMFAQLNYVEVLDVAENKITEIQKQAFKDLFLTNINISHNALSKIEPLAFEHCSNITRLDLSHNLLTDFPRDAFDENTYATELQLSYNKLTDMHQIPLHNMTGLKVLNVSHNQIVTIPKNTFPKLYELHTIDASHNNISQIANAVFQVLFSLRNLNLSYNALETIKPPMFGTLPTLLDLDLSNNQLKDIARGALTKLASLRMLTLENNQLDKIFTIPISLNHLVLRNNWIMEVPEKIWPVMNALLSIDLSGNRLMDNLRTGSFAGLLTLQTLTLDQNGISRIPWESLVGLTTLQYLHLSSNNLTELPKGAFGKLPVVFEVNMYNNQIHDISKRAFDGLLQLLTLNLSQNALKTIPNEAFFSLVSLRILDLSHNQIEKIDNKTNGLLDDCLSLEKIDLSHNKISFVTRKTFPSSPWIPYRLKEIDLSFNSMPVLTYDLVFGTKKVTTLNVSHNAINDFRKYVLGNLTALETLDLSHNSLTDLTMEPHIFDLPENLTNFYLQNNNLIAMPMDKLVNASKLQLLDLRGNQLETIDIGLIERIKSGMNLLFDGNPLRCDCAIRPLTHYLQTLTELPEQYSDVRCNTPQYVEGESLATVQDDHLNCVINLNTTLSMSGDEYDIMPDLKFRDIHYFKGNLSVRWFVSGPRDIADFYLNIRDIKNVVLLERHLAYNSRIVQIPGSEINEKSGSGKFLQICVLAKNSEGAIGGWYESQCAQLPENFVNIKRKYTNTFNYAYSVYSLDKKPKRLYKYQNDNLSSSAIAAGYYDSNRLLSLITIALFSHLWKLNCQQLRTLEV